MLQNISGSGFKLASQVLLEKWAVRGQERDVLAAIRTQVFNSPPPAPWRPPSNAGAGPVSEFLRKEQAACSDTATLLAE